MTNETEPRHQGLFVASLAMANFAVGALTVVAALFLIDISNTFNVHEGVAGQINTGYSVAAVVFAVLMGGLSLKVRHATLLLMGLLLVFVSALGSYLAVEFVSLLLFYSLSGVGFAMVSPMVITLVGENIPLKKRPNAVGWVVAGGAMVFVVGAPLLALISEAGGWRFAVLTFVVPAIAIGLTLVYLGLRSVRTHAPHESDRKNYVGSYMEVLTNKSAAACLACDVLRSASFVAVLLFAVSFVRERFLLPRSLASLVLLGGAVAYTVASIIGGPFVSKYGRKNSAVLAALLSGLFTISYAFVPVPSFSIVLIFASSWFFGMVASATNSLVSEQIPTLRGTIMSLDSAAINVGSALGTAIGGFALITFDYEGMGLALGLMGVAAALIIQVFAKDPTGEQAQK